MSSNILNWFLGGRVCESSKCMAAIASGAPAPMFKAYPLDPDDFNRCLLLLKAAPEVRNAFPEIANLSPVWLGLILNWDAIEGQFLEEAGLDWCKAISAPKTYKMIQDIREAADKQYADVKAQLRKVTP